MVASVLKDHSAFIVKVKHFLPKGQEDEHDNSLLKHR